MTPAAWGFLGSLFVAAITGVGAFTVAALNRRASPYDKLAERVLALEESDTRKSKRIYELECRLDASKARERLRDQHITALENHIRAGLGPPPPERPYWEDRHRKEPT